MNPLGSRHLATGLGAAVRSFVARHPVFAFVGLAHAFSWAWWLPQAFAEHALQDAKAGRA